MMEAIVVVGVVVVGGFAVAILKRTFSVRACNMPLQDYGFRFSRSNSHVTALGAHTPQDAVASAESWIEFETEVET